jgi:hypothetical protein
MFVNPCSNWLLLYLLQSNDLGPGEFGLIDQMIQLCAITLNALNFNTKLITTYTIINISIFVIFDIITIYCGCWFCCCAWTAIHGALAVDSDGED